MKYCVCRMVIDIFLEICVFHRVNTHGELVYGHLMSVACTQPCFKNRLMQSSRPNSLSKDCLWVISYYRDKVSVPQKAGFLRPKFHRVSYRIFCWGGGGKKFVGQCVWACTSTHALVCVQARGVWGHAPPGKKIFFRSSQIASHAIWDKISSYYFDDTYM